MLKSSRSFISLALSLIALYQNNAHAETISVELSEEVSALLDDPSINGPHEYTSYTQHLESSSYKNAIIYQPIGDGPFPATTLTPGFTNSKEDFLWLGQQLASHGIVAIVFTPTNAYSLDTKVWAKGHVGAIAMLKRENLRTNSPLFGKIDTNSLGLMGYSFGGAGAVQAADELKSEIKAVATFNAYRPKTPATSIPYLFVVGNKDTVAFASIVNRTFESMTTSAPRAFANINGLDHFGVLTRGNKHKEISRHGISWMKTYLAEDLSYMTFIDGPEIAKIQADKTVFAKPTDYSFIPAE